MKYEEIIELHNGKKMLLRNGVFGDGLEVYNLFNETHGETDFLLSYPDENSFSLSEESVFLQNIADSDNCIEILAVVDGKIVGSAGFQPIGGKEKIKHRCEFGISVLKKYWGLGIGKALTNACIKCAAEKGYDQMELDVVGNNMKAISLYKSVGFVEFGRNPKGFKSKTSGYQELVMMRLELGK